MHILCTICSDLVNQAENIYVTKCGHVFHYHCLSQWIGRSKTCPQCRCKITDKCMFRLYPTISNEGTSDDAATLQSRLDDASLQLRQQKAACKDYDEKLEKLNVDLKKKEELIKSYDRNLVSTVSKNHIIKKLLEKHLLKTENAFKTLIKLNERKLTIRDFKIHRLGTTLCKFIVKTEHTFRELIKSHERKLVNRDSAISAMKDQMLYLKVQNQETCKLKEENEELKKNMQTLTGLQKVLNATSSEVETMLQGYTDLKTVATFATALKRALCESEIKKNETRNRLNSTKHALSLEKSKVAELQKKLNSVEEDFYILQSKYETVRSKRKASEVKDMTESPPKLLRRSDSYDRFNTAILNDSGSSVESMAQRIENSESPYLSLKQSNLALAALQRRALPAPMKATMKPSEYAILNAARNITHRKHENSNTSIFHQKQPLQPEPSERPNQVNLDISYDGLGGHSKLDTFPVPLKKSKSLVPKLTAKHKLKRPTPAASQDICKFLDPITIVRDLRVDS